MDLEPAGHLFRAKLIMDDIDVGKLLLEIERGLQDVRPVAVQLGHR